MGMAQNPNISFGKAVSWLLLVSLLLPPRAIARAATKSDSEASFGQEVMGINGGVSEFYFRQDKDDVLIPVFVLGAVGKPGLYHVPVKSDLVTLLSIAGGLSENADHDSILLRDNRKKDPERLSMEDLVSESSTRNRQFLGNEILYVEKSEPIISNNTMLALGFVTTLISVVLAAKVLSK